jgi:peptidoglycan DL-endopeptidase CwlO
MTPARRSLASPVRPRRGLALLAAVLAATVLGVLAPAVAAHAEPGDEGQNKQLIQNVEAAARGYLEAKTALDASKAKQAQMAAELRSIEAELGPLRTEVGKVAATAYISGRLTTIGALLSASSSDDFLARAATLEQLTQREDDSLARLGRLQSRAQRNKEAIDAEVAIQAAQAAEMQKRLKAAQKLLAKASIRGYIDPNSPLAKPAPRNADGSWPKETCSVKDPTGTGGCVTPRTLHAYNQARANGFGRYTKCWRQQSWGEHPRGRACDFSVAVGTFGGTATTEQRAYGDKLAYFFIKNSSALGVLYVIWYRKIWFPGLGWRSYDGCCGASAEHTNHVHLSIV